MIDADALKLEISTLLTGLIGTYTFSEGQTCPAIRVQDGGDPFPEEPDVNGLEVVIRPEVEITFQPMLAGDRRLDFRSEVVLKQWEITDTTKTARDVLMARLSGLEEVGVIVPRSTVLDTVESCTLIVGDGFYVLG